MRLKRSPLELRIRRHKRIRKKVAGTAERPRLAVFRSCEHIYAQIIDDTAGHTIAAASTLEPAIRPELSGKNKTARASVIGEVVTKRALERGVQKVVFDRGGFDYHGRVKALADAARAGGLSF